VLLCVAGTSFSRSTAQMSCPPPSLPTQLLGSKLAAKIDNPAALPLQVYVKIYKDFYYVDVVESKYMIQVQVATIVQVGVQAGNQSPKLALYK
jgi:hypothetical protein